MKIFSPAFSKEINKFQGYQENSLPDWIVDTTKQNLNKNNNFTINNQAFSNLIINLRKSSRWNFRFNFFF